MSKPAKHMLYISNTHSSKTIQNRTHAEKVTLYNITAYLGKHKKCAIPKITAIHATVIEMIEYVEQKLLTNDFLPPDLFDLLLTMNINCCDTVRLNKKVMAWGFEQKLKIN
jgi:hypothetical protein